VNLVGGLLINSGVATVNNDGGIASAGPQFFYVRRQHFNVGPREN
jgi:hypothetical protein